MSYEQYLDAYNTFWELKEKYDKKIKNYKKFKKSTNETFLKLNLTYNNLMKKDVV